MRAIEEFRYLVLAAQREGNRLLAGQLRPWGVTPSQAEVLRVLGERPGLTLGGLGELLVCESGTNPSRLVDRLVVAGLVMRTPGETDRREVVLTLTDRGHEVEREVRAIEEEWYAALLALLPAADLDVAVRTLKRAVAGLPSGDAVARRSGRLASG